MLKVKPSDVGIALETVGVSAAFAPAANEVALKLLDPVGAPGLDEDMVVVDEVFGAKPVTVTSPDPLMATDPPFVAVPDQV